MGAGRSLVATGKYAFSAQNGDALPGRCGFDCKHLHDVISPTQHWASVFHPPDPPILWNRSPETRHFPHFTRPTLGASRRALFPRSLRCELRTRRYEAVIL